VELQTMRREEMAKRNQAAKEVEIFWGASLFKQQ
jgi:hypothetical protein